MLPTFLGVGVPKAGTTWIHDVLQTHPEVLMASRKEVHYFDGINFERGLAWYERFFASPEGSAASVIGEFTPHYLYNPAVPARIRSVPSVERLILILRNPVDRAVSHYRYHQQVENYRGSFEEFLVSYPRGLDWGRYATHLRPWLDEFDLGQFLILVYEDAVGDPDGTKRRLAECLGIDPAAFPAHAGRAASNVSFLPRYRRAYAAAARQARLLRRHDLQWAVDLGLRAGVKRLLSCRSGSARATHISQEVRERLWREFEPEIDALEALCGLDLGCWRRACSAT